MTGGAPMLVVNKLPFDDAARARLDRISGRLRIVHQIGDDTAMGPAVEAEVEGLVGYRPPADLARTPRLRWFQVGSCL